MENEIINKIIQGDSLQVLKSLSEKTVSCVMTSPPYWWALRDYGENTSNTIWDLEYCKNQNERENCLDGKGHDFEIVERQLHSGTLDVTKTVHHALKVCFTP